MIPTTILNLYCNTYNINDYVIKVIIKMNNKSNCSGQALTMAYVPWQKWEDIYSPEEGFARGTIFAQLDKSYIGRKCK